MSEKTGYLPNIAACGLTAAPELILGHLKLPKTTIARSTPAATCAQIVPSRLFFRLKYPLLPDSVAGLDLARFSYFRVTAPSRCFMSIF